MKEKRFILLGESSLNNDICGVSQYTKNLALEFANFDINIQNFVLPGKFTIKEFKNLYILIDKNPSRFNYLIINMNTLFYARSVLLRLFLFLVFLKKTQIILIMHEDIFKSVLHLLFNAPLLLAHKIIINRDKKYFSRITQLVLKKRCFLINNPCIKFNKDDIDCFKLKENKSRFKKDKLIIGIFGILNSDKGFDKAVEILNFKKDLELYIFSDMDVSSRRDLEYKNKLFKSMKKFRDRITVFGKLDLSNKNIVNNLVNVDIGLFPYRKNAGLWNTTLRTIYDLRIPIISVNFVDEFGWDKYKRVFTINNNSSKSILNAIERLRTNTTIKSKKIELRNMNNVAKELIQII